MVYEGAVERLAKKAVVLFTKVCVVLGSSYWRLVLESSPLEP